jgi:hypothetical protein
MTPASPWPHLAPWPREREGPFHLDLAADEPTRKAVARFLGLEDIIHLSARLTVQAWLDGAEISGDMEARFTRLCGLTLEPFEVLLNEPVFLRALPASSAHAPPPPTGEIDLELQAEDPPEVLGAEGVDLGDVVVQTLALALDPFPRKPGAIFEAPQASQEDSPFGILARLTEPKD